MRSFLPRRAAGTTINNIQLPKIRQGSHSPSRVKTLPGQGAALRPVLGLTETVSSYWHQLVQSLSLSAGQTHIHGEGVSPRARSDGKASPVLHKKRTVVSFPASVTLSSASVITTRKLSLWNPASTWPYKQWPVHSKGGGSPGWGLRWTCAHTVTWERLPGRGQSQARPRESHHSCCQARREEPCNRLLLPASNWQRTALLFPNLPSHGKDGQEAWLQERNSLKGRERGLSLRFFIFSIL